MKHPASILGLVAALGLALPATGFSKSKSSHSHSKSNNCGSHNSSRYCPPARNYRYCPPVSVYRNWNPYLYSYPYYGSFYARPAFGVSITTSPSYYRSNSSDYADDLAVDVQRALRRRGYYQGEIDGDVGAGTRAAIRKFQYNNQLEVTGRIDRSLLRSLGLN